MELMNELKIVQVGEAMWEMNKLNLPNLPAVYFIWDSTKKLIYIGQTKALCKRTVLHFYQDIWFKLFARYISYIDVLEEELRSKEYSLIQEFRPKFNFEHYATPSDGDMKEAVQRKPII